MEDQVTEEVVDDQSEETVTDEPSEELFKIGDTEYSADELIEFYEKAKSYENLQAEFTRKSQELAELKKAQVKEEDPDIEEGVRNLAPFVEKINAPLMAEIAYLKEQLRGMTIQSEVEKLKSEFSDADPDAVMAFATQNRIGTLRQAYLLMNLDKETQKAAKEAKAQALRDQKRKQKAKTPDSTSSLPSGLRPFDPEKDGHKTPMQLAEEGLRELGIKVGEK